MSGSRRSTRIYGRFVMTAFLPHGTWREGEGAPSSRSCSPSMRTIPTARTVRFLVDGCGGWPEDAEGLSAHRAAVRRRGIPDALAAGGASAVSEGKAKGFDVHLLADRRAGSLAAQGVSGVLADSRSLLIQVTFARNGKGPGGFARGPFCVAGWNCQAISTFATTAPRSTDPGST